MSINLEYAIKQDIKNNPVVREVDQDQRREFVRMIGHAAVIVAMLMFALWPRTSRIADGYTYEKLQDELAREKKLQRMYRLEIESMRRPQEVQHRATHELHMVEPTERDTVVIGLAPAGTPADRAIVAAVR
jgi:hypothetical protein